MVLLAEMMRGAEGAAFKTPKPQPILKMNIQ
jgi:hypothetical protein